MRCHPRYLNFEGKDTGWTGSLPLLSNYPVSAQNWQRERARCPCTSDWFFWNMVQEVQDTVHKPFCDGAVLNVTHISNLLT